jgi:hypothetical protein
MIDLSAEVPAPFAPGMVDRAVYTFRVGKEDDQARQFNTQFLQKNQGQYTALSARAAYSEHGDLGEVTLLAFMDEASLQDYKKSQTPARTSTHKRPTVRQRTRRR